MSLEHPYPDYAYLEVDPETNEKRWFGTKGMGVCYVHEDRVAEAIDAAIAAERERCAKIADSMAFESKIAIANYKAIGELADAARHDHYRTRSTEIAAAIRRGKP